MKTKIIRTSFAILTDDWAKFKKIIGQNGQKAQFVLENLVKQFIEDHEDKEQS